MTDSEPEKHGNHLPDAVSPLTEEEISRLLGDDISPAERAALLERLANDPDAQQVLALAASPHDEPMQGLSRESVDRLMRLVRESGALTGVCPHCAGDLHPTGDFCPHCGARVAGSVMKCIRCGKPVHDDGYYCPHCGSMYRPIGRKKPPIPLFVLILGLLCIVLAPFFRFLLIPLLMLGSLMLGLWLGDVLGREGKQGKAADVGEAERIKGKKKA